MYKLFRPLLFSLDPERAHALVLTMLRLAGVLSPVRKLIEAAFAPPAQPVQAFGLTFKNRVGLAAGYDKDGSTIQGLAALGFGHIEIGTVTLRPQEGNPPPRLFRLPEDRALINRMGFPSRGAEFVVRRLLKERKTGAILGVNLGKNRQTPLERAAEDYVNLLHTFARLADYLAINVSSPNTEGLRDLQARQALEGLLSTLAEERQKLYLNKPLPILVKLSPDLGDAELDGALDVILSCGMDGVIAANTTLDRIGLHSRNAIESGGSSGEPLRRRSTEMVGKIARRTQWQLPIIGVGGVMDRQSFQDKLDAGATLVQVFTGLVYQGPLLVRHLLS